MAGLNECMVRVEVPDWLARKWGIYEDIEGQPIVPYMPFNGYDDLAAAQVIDLLAIFNDEGRAKLRQYEAERKNRKTILEAIDQWPSP